MMFNWVEIAQQNSRERYEELSAFLNENQFPNKVDFIEATEANLSEVIVEAQKKYHGVRVGRGLGELILPLLTDHDGMVEKVRAADALVRQDGKWWLRANAVDGFRRVLVREGERLDLGSSVLVVGAGAAARVAITGLFMTGFKNFVVSNLEEKRAHEMAQGLRKTHLGIHLEIVPKDGLILLPGVHGLLVNTTPMTKDNAMLEELYYFNFFKMGGVAVDFSISPVDTPLLLGAKDIGATCLFGYQISAQTDLIWCEQISGRSFSSVAYEERLAVRLREKDKNSNPG